MLKALLKLPWTNRHLMTFSVRRNAGPASPLTTPASGFLLRPLLKVEASVEEQLSSYRAVRPSLMAELMEMVHMLEA